MHPTRITTRGSFTASRPPERATVHAVVSSEGAEPEAVYQQAAGAVEELSAALAGMHDPATGPVTRYAVHQVRIWADRPWQPDGGRPSVVHHASATLYARFRDFDAAGRWLGAAASVPGFGVDRIEWSLPSDEQRRVLDEARTAAVHDARDKARTYAEALGLGDLRVLEVADAGMLGDVAGPGTGSGGIELAAFARDARDAGGEPQVRLIPRDLEFTVQVDARFEATGEGRR